MSEGIITETGYTVSDLVRELGTTARAIRYYESLGLLHPRRTAGGHRLYSRRDRARLRLILRGRRLGFSLGEIAELLSLYDIDPSAREQFVQGIRLTRRRLDAVRRRIQELEDLARDLERALQDAETRLKALGGEVPTEHGEEQRAR
ncbi:MAG: MerR family transcriptional regulator [Actinomycetia bacterium]|nr:MerR family transcriptional regulator [Actinomycetes bacterium]